MARARLSMAFEDVRGRMGQQVVSKTQGGLVAKRLPKYKYPKVAAVQQGSDRMRQANAAWNELTLAQVQAWQHYASGVERVEPVTGARYSMTAKSAFVALTIKFLQMHPGQPVPMWPPVEPSLSEGVVLLYALLPEGVRFAASAANSPGVLTEVLFQKLVNVRRSPTKFYKSLAFHTFVPGSLTLDVPLEAGVYAFAYRFVRSDSGQQTDWVRLPGIVEV